MSATEKLIETCQLFQRRIRETTSELISSRPTERSEQLVAKKLQKLSLFSTKKTFLRASNLPSTSKLTEKDGSVLKQEYEAVVSNKVLEQFIVKVATQADIIKKFVRTPTDSRNIAKKKELIKSITDFIIKENTLQVADTVLQEKEAELVSVREEWYGRVKEMRARRDLPMEDTEDEETDESDITSDRLSRLQLLCWVVQKTAIGRSSRYDWLADIHERLAAIKGSRKCTVDVFKSL